ncbi:MarR family winged helix-turn-helix transcriptional regulator [Amycolatopsis regifaucium]|uniref:MarR family transcriptional regulator n=1 Tax=Amycolatopsis regifaucium TaxID=546365 RepID=A0A154MBW4_9PSEU|nr:MarR family transcriptional regulator [Amycolatopsis regifaucium]KZB81770.1 MarR family transcriptional regulator [Amycolatopsis regifaucium]OKA06162.1 MarR family transcriptional regulator [Amycolatopsis regifaucium]SFG70954.1 DNA-binding transcriptional regulator, MarR family [Amycolatopsis regifaucium]
MTNWLDADQQRDWRAFIEGSVRFVDLLDRRLRERHGLSLAEFELLVRLSEAEGQSMRMADLAKSAYYSRSRLSHRVNGLESRGLVRRESAAEDGRGVSARLTEAGDETLRRAAPDNLRTVREHFVDVIEPEDLRAVGRAMTAVTRRLED